MSKVSTEHCCRLEFSFVFVVPEVVPQQKEPGFVTLDRDEEGHRVTQMWISRNVFFVGIRGLELPERSHTLGFIKADGRIAACGHLRWEKALEASNAQPSGQIASRIGLSARCDDFILQIVSPLFNFKASPHQALKKSFFSFFFSFLSN